MKHKLTNNQMILNDYIKSETEKFDSINSEEEYFEYFSAQQILKDYDLDDDEIEMGLVGGKLDGGCDGIYIFLNKKLITSFEQIENEMKELMLELVIIQSKKTYSFKEDVLMKWKTMVENLLYLDSNMERIKKRYNENILFYFSLFKKIYRCIAMKRVKLNLNFYYVTLSVNVHDNVKQQAEELKQKVKEYYPTADVSVNFEGANELFKRYNTISENVVNLQLKETPISLGSKHNYIAVVSLKNYYKFIVNKNNEIKKAMFEANVRDYQGKNTVNKSIYETLKNKTDEDFWWLNNGVTILATEAILINTKEIQLINPEVVNGLQTSTEIYNYYVNDLSILEKEDRCLLVRIIVPENEKSRDSIIFATNNQTSIPKTSLRATDEIHLQIEMYLKNKGLYYDRRKNYYKNQGKKRDKIISISFLSQCLITLFLKKPDYARARPSTILMDETTYRKLYNSKIDLEIFYKVALIGRNIEIVIKHSSEFTRTERTDILFYVLYAVVIKLLQKEDINEDDIKNLDVNLITDDLINNIKNIVYKRYKELGGTGAIAKSSNFINEVIQIVLC